jgi:tRNA uridine 5-carboxymethylaminomethyl modification enzyme
VNAALKVSGSQDVFSVDRTQGYMGVMIDDLITLGTQEPYRMFTSRAEYRLLLRADNADQRLTPLGEKFGLISAERLAAFHEKKKILDTYLAKAKGITITPPEAAKKGMVVNQDGRRRNILDLLSLPAIQWQDIITHWPEFAALPKVIQEQLEIEGKYSGYLDRQVQDIESFRKDSNVRIPESLDYNDIGGLSNEMRLKLTEAKPDTIAAASRIPGVTPAALTSVLGHIQKIKKNTAA